MAGINVTLVIFFISLVVLTNSITVHPSIKGKFTKLLKDTHWNWKHLNTVIRPHGPVSLDVDVISKFRLHGKLKSNNKVYRDCSEILKANPSKKGKDAVHTIYPDLKNKKLVYCDMTTDGGGWTVVQKRRDGITNFYNTWNQYKIGFGDPKKNYWIGNDVLHLLTKSGNQVLRVDLQRFNGQKAYAKYSKFSVGDESSKYRLTVSGYRGTAGNSLSYHNGMKFTTKDQDNDKGGGNCATTCKGAWWYKSCYYSNLNGQYANSAVVSGKYLNWYHWGNKHEALRRTSMMIRPLT
ncbi:ryncolin-1-like [Ostrea edulis]|uniref:ryncolin-1-like n=1 Tax=Ostrea edulis TaxID=37623 RepID=UPI0024AFEA72|nr:ryncolin-1-like [Ostrea edulis]